MEAFLFEFVNKCQKQGIEAFCLNIEKGIKTLGEIPQTHFFF